LEDLHRGRRVRLGFAGEGASGWNGVRDDFIFAEPQGRVGNDSVQFGGLSCRLIYFFSDGKLARAKFLFTRSTAS